MRPNLLATRAAGEEAVLQAAASGTSQATSASSEARPAHRVSGRPWAVYRALGPEPFQLLTPQATGRAMPVARRFPPRLLGDGKR